MTNLALFLQRLHRVVEPTERQQAEWPVSQPALPSAVATRARWTSADSLANSSIHLCSPSSLWRSSDRRESTGMKVPSAQVCPLRTCRRKEQSRKIFNKVSADWRLESVEPVRWGGIWNFSSSFRKRMQKNSSPHRTATVARGTRRSGSGISSFQVSGLFLRPTREAL